MLTDKNITFKYNLREYQERALKEIDKYINDNKIHIVAAPGSGKTILGLKIGFELNKNMLILTPTIAIREQWVNRMLEDFENVDRNFISTDIKALNKINILTYQALYQYNKESIKEMIQTNNIQTIIMDEAHHLRNAWWNLLSQIFSEITDVKIISLTATPPYDDEKNYNKYIDLCGEIDSLIGIPELVKQKNLCPHQDFIYFSAIDEIESKKINDFRKKTLNIINNLNTNERIIKAIATHQYFIDYKNNLDNILDNYEVFIIMLKYLKYNNINIDRKINIRKKINNMKVKDYEILLKYLLQSNDDNFKIISNDLNIIEDELKRLGAYERNNINLLYNRKIVLALEQNKNKLKGINSIIEEEYKSIGNNLKLIVVTDYIKDNYNNIEEEESEQLGVIPIFKSIKDRFSNLNVMVLTGTTVIIPSIYIDKLKNICSKNNIKEEAITTKVIDYDLKYTRVELKNNHKMVKVITELYENTDTVILIGTVALIGEGWDAPFINTLIIASNISTYITSNQVRGRVIRIDKMNLNKEANIWHLTSLEKVGSKYLKGKDFEKIEKRFNNIEGLSLTRNIIESNINRFDLPSEINSKEEIININNIMISESQKRDNIYSRWFEALYTYIPNSKLYLNKDKVVKDKKLIYYNNLSNIIGLGITDLITLYSNMTNSSLLTILLIPLVGYFNVKYVMKRKDYDKDALECISKALLNALKQKNIIDDEAVVKITKFNSKYEVILLNSDSRAQSLFIRYIKEAISKQNTTRYILIAGNKVFNVPTIFDKNRKEAEFFRKVYTKTNGLLYTKLIYSNNEQGKLEKLRLLLEQEKEENKTDMETEIFNGNVDIKWLTSALNLDQIEIEKK